MKRGSAAVTAPSSSRHGRRQRIVTALLILATLVAAIVAEHWVAEQLDDHLVATMLMLIAGVVIMTLTLPFVARFR